MKELPKRARIVHEFWSEHVPLVSYSIVVLFKQKVYAGCGTSACNPIDEFNLEEGKRVAKERAVKQILFAIREDSTNLFDKMMLFLKREQVGERPHHWQLRHESLGTEETIKVRVAA